MELEIGGHNYKTGRLTPLQQFHITRRIGPVILALADTFRLAAAAANEKGLSVEDAFLGHGGPVVQAVSQMTDVDSEYVINTCMGVCTRQQDGGGWARVQALPGKLMFEDIDMQVMLRLTMEVCKENMGNFMSALPV